MIYFTKDFIQFFEELSKNNNKEWFEDNKKRYENSVKKPFLALVEDIIPFIKSIEPNFKEEAKKTIFRINRDVRFSKDKSPYKTNVAAVFNPRGKNSEFPGFYIHVDAKECWIGGGCYELSKENLSKVRNEILIHHEKWNQILQDQTFKSIFQSLAECETNKKVPEEFKSFDNLPTDLLKKRFYFMLSKPSDLLLSDQLMPEIQKCYLAGLPILGFLGQAFI